MGQRITLTYSIDLEELPDEVNRLYDDLSDHLCSLSSVSKPKDVLSIECLNELERTKNTLLCIEYKIQDIENIVKSYLKYITSDDKTERPSELSALSAIYKNIAELSKNISDDNEVTD